MITRYQIEPETDVSCNKAQPDTPSPRSEDFSAISVIRRSSRLIEAEIQVTSHHDPPPPIKNRPEGATALTNDLTGNYQMVPVGLTRGIER